MASRSRPVYFDGMELNDDDFECQQSYLNTLRKDYCAGLHTWGVAYGLDVTAGPDTRSVQISPGMAIAPVGDELWVNAQLVQTTPNTGAGRYDLFLGSIDKPTDIDSSSLALGFKRMSSSPVLKIIPRGSSVSQNLVFLTTIDLDSNGSITNMDSTARRYCGLETGCIQFTAPPDGQNAGLFQAEKVDDSICLNIKASATKIEGLIGITDGLSLSDTPRAAALDVIETGRLVSIQNQKKQDVMDTDASGRTWIGLNPQSSRTARLTVEGNISLGDNASIIFNSTGQISWAKDKASLALKDQTVTLRSEGFQAMKAGNISDSWIMDETGKIGIGLAKPAYPLSVEGCIQSLKGGIEIGDTYIQKTAANSTSVMIGAIIDWWCADDNWEIPDGYAICNGKKVPDKTSPLYPAILPDLDGLYIIGAESFDQIGVTDTTDTHTHEILEIPAHVHSIQHSHRVSGQVDPADDSGDSDSSDDHCSRRHHIHQIDEPIDPCPQTECDANSQIANPIPTNSASTTPPSMTMVKLMRIK